MCSVLRQHYTLPYISYFREPWACAVFHDRFPDFVDEVREHLAAPLVRSLTTRPRTASSLMYVFYTTLNFYLQEGGGESFEQKVQKLVEDESTVR